jgi:hypothetical protein
MREKAQRQEKSLREVRKPERTGVDLLHFEMSPSPRVDSSGNGIMMP